MAHVVKLTGDHNIMIESHFIHWSQKLTTHKHLPARQLCNRGDGGYEIGFSACNSYGLVATLLTFTNRLVFLQLPDHATYFVTVKATVEVLLFFYVCLFVYSMTFFQLYLYSCYLTYSAQCPCGSRAKNRAMALLTCRLCCQGQQGKRDISMSSKATKREKVGMK